MENTNEKNTQVEEKKITRKDAIKKTGYAALSAATMMVLLSNNANACHTSPSGWMKRHGRGRHGRGNRGNHYGNGRQDNNNNDNSRWNGWTNTNSGNNDD